LTTPLLALAGTPMEAFDLYLGLGYRPIPARPRSKEPLLRWGGRYRADLARRVLEKNPQANLALLLGDGGRTPLVDVEGDTPEANDLISDLCRGHDHPMFASRKSIHHLFKCPDPFLTVLKHGGVEFRGNRHISVVPPSTHPTGQLYRWLTDPAMPVPDMPGGLADWYWDRRPRKWGRKVRGKAGPWCGGCGGKFVVDRARFELELEAFRKHGQAWHCHACRVIDVRDICRFVKRQQGR
jgi:hypothetical protein